MKATLATKVFAGFLAIFLLFTAVVAVNYQLSRKVLRNLERVTRSQRVTSDATSLLRNIIDMESGFRGYLLIGNEALLVPYYQGERELLSGFAHLKNTLNPQGRQYARLQRMHRLYQQWSGYSHLLITEKREASRRLPNQTGLDGMEHRALMESLSGKELTDEIRTMFRNFDRAELADRDELRAKLADSIQETRVLSIVITLLAVVLGLLWAYYVTRLFARRISTMVSLATRLAGGDYKTRIDDTAHDELSELATSLNVMSNTIDTTVTQLENRNQELDQFAYVVSHDLKAPLRGIESASRWIEEDMGQQLPDHIREFLQLMRTRVHRMENLITGILDLARVGRMRHVNERVNVRELLTETMDMLSLPAGFRIELPSYLPTLFTSRVELQQVFSNLLSNAVKYHHQPEKGWVRIGCTEHRAHYTFTIADNGPGIAPEYHERIFVIFQTLTERDTLESTGVGLAIVKKIIERQGGTILVESAEGKGARFIFTWPKVKELRLDDPGASTPAVAETAR
ncbi:ATP-binding protein [Hymenobacter sp. J193]|uniref:sensor histidine kinase n=1 Tax=Hymenobacter sp. J193 TaxID=2898429 RepID=UPI0021517FD9|nr:ATP-binding protein [Hymenobacter sp. J193]MCR5888940.1 ATP-binding protein [Hymenobacter sp. J193]